MTGRRRAAGSPGPKAGIVDPVNVTLALLGAWIVGAFPAAVLVGRFLHGVGEGYPLVAGAPVPQRRYY